MRHRSRSRSNSSSSMGGDVSNGSVNDRNNNDHHHHGRWSQMEELEEVFKKFDANGDGKISAAELGSILGGLGYRATEEELRKMMEEVDKDGDGYIDLQEFIELNTKGVDSTQALACLRDAFSVYDIDGNGSISAEELHQVMRSLDEDCSIDECRRMISGVDCDGDGTISFDEFKKMMLRGSRFEIDEAVEEESHRDRDLDDDDRRSSL